MDNEKGVAGLVVQLAIVLIIIGASVVRWILHRRALARGEKVEGPPPEEPRLPYEDVVDEVFGPYMRRRRQRYEEARAGGEEPGVEVVEVVEEEAPPPPPKARAPEAPKPPPATPALPPVVVPVRPSFEERVFQNPRWGAAAKLVVAGEILGRPRAFRPHGPGRPR